MDSLVLETVIGLVFVFAVFASVVTVLTEMISRFIGLRGEYLMRGLRTLLDGGGSFSLTFADMRRKVSVGPAPQDKEPEQPMITRVLSEQLLQTYADKGDMPINAGNAKLSNPDRRKLPSYISARSIAQSVIAVLVPDASSTTTMDQIREGLNGLPDGRVRSALQQLAAQAEDDIAKFRLGIEHWYDDQMDRVSGWYKRHVRWISLAIGVVLVLAFNLNGATIARSLYADEALRGAVVTEAADAATCGTKDPAACLSALRAEVSTFRDAGLPIGWGTVAACATTAPGMPSCDWLQARGLTDPGPTHNLGSDLLFFLAALVGWALMVLTLLPGARFWFDALSRLGSLRASGPKPDRAPTAS
jgi:hypothetical protein